VSINITQFHFFLIRPIRSKISNISEKTENNA
jgi:hypothetical protein